MKKRSLLITALLLFSLSCNEKQASSDPISSVYISSITSSSLSVETSEVSSSAESSSNTVSSSSSSSVQVSTRYTNPVYDLDFADPSIIRADDGYFYAYATGGKILKSPDLINWERKDNAFVTNPRWGTSGAGLWAPDIVKIGDKYILYYSLSRWDDPNPGIGIGVSSSPLGPFTDQGKLFNSQEIGVNNSIDPMVYVEDGRVYMFWGSFQGIYVVELTNDGLSLKGGIEGARANKILVAGFDTARPLDITTYEGVYIIKKDGYYYMFLSNGLCCSGDKTYNVRVARSTTLLGPYYDSSNRDMLNSDRGTQVLIRSNFFIAPGHNSIIKDDDGEYWIVYHAYPVNVTNRRVLLIDKLIWDNNGWPTVLGLIPSNTSKKAPIIQLASG